MKIRIDVDLSPEEMRRLVGLPDVETFNKELMDQMREKMLEGAEGYDALSLFQPYFATSLSGMDMFRQMMEATVKGFSGGTQKHND